MVEKITEFKIKQTEIPGLLEIDIPAMGDERGYFQEKFQKEKLVALGFPSDYNAVQHNISYNKNAGVTRGIHAEPFRKYITIIKGSVHAVFVDLRPGENFGKKVEITLDDKKAVLTPVGIGNSFQTLEPDTYYSYLWDGHWSPTEKYISVNLVDPDLNIQWPIPLDKAIISEKDRNNPMLKDLQK